MIGFDEQWALAVPPRVPNVPAARMATMLADRVAANRAGRVLHRFPRRRYPRRHLAGAR